MRKSTYTIYDNISKIFNWPFAAFNDDDAIRTFSLTIKEKLSERTTEFSLFHNGYYDDSTGVWEPEEPHCVLRGNEINFE